MQEKVIKNNSSNQFIVNLIALAGGLSAFPSMTLRFFIKDTLDQDPIHITHFDTWTTSVWLLKPFMGFIIDNLADRAAHYRALLMFAGVI